MKIVTYNLHGGRSSTGVAVLPEIADALAERRADVIACQEVVATPDDEHADQAAWLAARLDMHARFAANAETRAGRLGNATLSRTRIETHDNIDLSVGRFERRGALATRLAHGLDVWNVHLGLTRRQRGAQWRRLAASLATNAEATIVCGDFNDWDGSLRRRLEAAGMHDALTGQPRRRRATFPARRPWLGLDRIYYRGIRLVACEVLRGAPWSLLSDHLPVEARFEPAPTGATA